MASENILEVLFSLCLRGMVPGEGRAVCVCGGGGTSGDVSELSVMIIIIIILF